MNALVLMMLIVFFGVGPIFWVIVLCRAAQAGDEILPPYDWDDEL